MPSAQDNKFNFRPKMIGAKDSLHYRFFCVSKAGTILSLSSSPFGPTFSINNRLVIFTANLLTV